MRQTRPADEIIVVDDGSTDGTADAVVAEHGDRVRLLRQDNRGPSTFGRLELQDLLCREGIRESTNFEPSTAPELTRAYRVDAAGDGQPDRGAQARADPSVADDARRRAPPLTISVVIPTYQRRALVLDAIESVMRQTRPAEEIIVVDDGSTDGTADALRREYGARIRLVSQRNRGPSGARNTGVALSCGDVLAFLDDDDRWRSSHLATIEALASGHPEAVLVSTCRNATFGEDEPEDAMCVDMTERLLLATEWVGAPSGVSVRRHAYLAVGGFDERIRFAEDLDLYLRLSLLGPMALISGRTFERLELPDSLWRKGVQEGMHFETGRAVASKVLFRLQRSSRADAPALRRAAAARLALEDAIASLAAGAPVGTVRPLLADVCGLAPKLRARPGSIARALPNSIPNWECPRRRVTTLATLIIAWPDRSGFGWLRLWRACARAARRAPDPALRVSS
jgi:glycosyltransferase involved in cell wall biosynthesis